MNSVIHEQTFVGKVCSCTRLQEQTRSDNLTSIFYTFTDSYLGLTRFIVGLALKKNSVIQSNELATSYNIQNVMINQGYVQKRMYV